MSEKRVGEYVYVSFLFVCFCLVASKKIRCYPRWRVIDV